MAELKKRPDRSLAHLYDSPASGSDFQRRELVDRGRQMPRGRLLDLVNARMFHLVPKSLHMPDTDESMNRHDFTSLIKDLRTMLNVSEFEASEILARLSEFVKDSKFTRIHVERDSTTKGSLKLWTAIGSILLEPSHEITKGNMSAVNISGDKLFRNVKTVEQLVHLKRDKAGK